MEIESFGYGCEFVRSEGAKKVMELPMEVSSSNQLSVFETCLGPLGLMGVGNGLEQKAKGVEVVLDRPERLWISLWPSISVGNAE
jgi:hypothetical protein